MYKRKKVTFCARPGHTVRLPPMPLENSKFPQASHPTPAPLYTPYLTHNYMGNYFRSNYKQNFYGNPVVDRYPRSFLPEVNPKPYYHSSFVRQG